MTLSSQNNNVAPRARVVANGVAVLAVFIIALVPLLFAFVADFHPSSMYDYGLGVDAWSWQVIDVNPGGPADKAGVKVGDTIQVPRGLHDRYLFTTGFGPTRNESVTLVVRRGDVKRAVTLKAAPLLLSQEDALSQGLLALTCFILLLVGALLALVRPSIMTWGFYFFGVAAVWLSNWSASLGSDYLILAFLLMWSALLVPAGLVGFVVFCLRFPTNETTGWRKVLYSLLPFLFAVLVAYEAFFILNDLVYRVSPWFGIWYQHIWDALLLAMTGLCLASFMGTYRSSRGLERQRIKWVIFGLACACVAFVFAVLQFENLIPNWVASLGTSVLVVLPLSVAYAVIRHRVIDVRFVLSRALVYGTIAVVIAAVVVFLDWLFSNKLAGSRSETAVYALVALVVGFCLNAARGRIGAAIDSLFFRQWHVTQELAEDLGAQVRRAAIRPDLYAPLTKGIAETFSLASAALFERAQDGGFVRVAAHNWPSGTLWHLLPDDPWAPRAERISRPIDLEKVPRRGEDLPAGIAHPGTAMPIVGGQGLHAILLLGAHANGTRLDPDELRAIRRLAEDAGHLYGLQRADTPGLALIPSRIASV